MRTPLNGILGLVDIISDKINNVPDFEDKEYYQGLISDLNADLGQLKNSGKFLLNLINDTLDVSKIENGNFKLSPVVVDGEYEIFRFARMIKNIADSKDIKLNLNYLDVVKVYYYMDSLRISQIFLNIISNSIKFSEAGSSIDVIIQTMEKKSDIVVKRFIIRDYGIGMDKEFLDKIFIPFEQETHEKEKSYRGTGLGMSIVKQIVDIMGGEIFIDSEKGKGTITTVILPLKIATKEQYDNAHEDDNIIENIDFKNMRVLLCEDNKVNAKVADNYLKKKDLFVELAENGKKALDMFNASPVGYYDFILMDIQMPIMDGIEATKEIRKSDHLQGKSIPIIALSTNIMDEEKRKAIQAGMNGYISKPIEINLLFNVIGKILNKSEL